MRRRAVLGLLAGATTGCLRMTGNESGTPTTRGGGSEGASGTGTTTAGSGATTTDTPTTATPTTVSGPIDLAAAWSADDDCSKVWTTDDSFLYEYRGGVREAAPDGSARWTSSEVFGDAGFPQTLAVDEETAYVGTFGPRTPDKEWGPARVVAVSRDDGGERWTVRAPDDGLHIDANGLARAGDLVVAPVTGNGSGEDQRPIVYGLDAASGERRWTLTSLPHSHYHRSHDYDGQPLVDSFAGVFLLDPATGSVVREFDLRVGFRGGTLDGGTYYGGTGSVAAINVATGARRWELSLPSQTQTPFVVDERTLHFGTEAGHVYALATADGSERWRSRVQTAVRTVTVSDAHVWVCDDAGTVAAFERSNGERVFTREAPEADSGERPVGAVGDVVFVGGEGAGGYTVEPA